MENENIRVSVSLFYELLKDKIILDALAKRGFAIDIPNIPEINYHGLLRRNNGDSARRSGS